MQGHPRIQRWFGTAGRPEAAEPAPGPALAAAPDLEAIRDAMRLAVAPCGEGRQSLAEGQLVGATSPLELWFIRADLFQYLSQDLGQMEAARRIALLMPVFAGVPGIAVPRRFPDNRAHDAQLD
ncbi:MAG: hypothetical protein JWQ72_531 [Polaromonas sp.]|nr:hypothetical protein [Polaromonas sp.]